jgi:hypothetical protein
MTNFSMFTLLSIFCLVGSVAFQPITESRLNLKTTECHASRRDLLACFITTATSVAIVGAKPEPSAAIGPVKIDLVKPTYSAVPCPKDKPIPGEKAMKGLKGLCVTVDVDLDSVPEKDLEKIGEKVDSGLSERQRGNLLTFLPPFIRH